jgi:hypothetical protein
MRTPRVLAWTCGALALLVGTGKYACDRLADGMCRNDVIAILESPDRIRKLVSFQRDCGATTAFSTQVSLLEYGGEPLPNDSGNVFISDIGGNSVPVGPGGGPEVRIRWNGSRTAIIGHHRAARVFLSEHQRDGVAFKYEPFYQ